MTNRIDEITNIAIRNAEKSLELRQEYAKKIRRNSFSAWGNDKCISRTIDTIRDMRNGNASDRQYAYWVSR